MATQRNERDRGFDAFRLARDRGVLEGDIDAATFPRVADLLASSPVPVHWRIRGGADAVGRPALTVEVDASVPLECQRCLETMTQPIVQRTELVLAANEAELAQLDEQTASEVLLADQPIDPLALVEDELVLGLPYIPRHAEDVCNVKQQ